jgi:hypothetical protein
MAMAYDIVDLTKAMTSFSTLWMFFEVCVAPQNCPMRLADHG